MLRITCSWEVAGSAGPKHHCSPSPPRGLRVCPSRPTPPPVPPRPLSRPCLLPGSLASGPDGACSHRLSEHGFGLITMDIREGQTSSTHMEDYHESST